MTLTSGTRIGPYEITGAIGAGGMGEVYRARDAKLGRDVALKVLPEAFARDGERMARFQREAKVLASLNHPNIAAIYGFEDSGATHALVMELVEGPTLADRIKTCAIPSDEALRVAKQICEALEYAHERGIVHRDLKPANVKVTPDDAVKVLDFGLAKAVQGEANATDVGNSPTISQMATESGVLLGTAGYMSPEQAKGKPVDRRADIWAFGCVLYEMLTGQRAFQGETVTDTLAAIMRAEPDWSLLPKATSTRVRMLLHRCLQKDAKQRLRDIGDARISLDEVLSSAPEGVPGLATVAPAWRRALPWGLFCTAAIAIAVLGWMYERVVNSPSTSQEMRFQISVPEKTILDEGNGLDLSPDGRRFAFFAITPDGIERLWIRAIDSLEARPLPGSEVKGGASPFFWSPDSRFIAFWSDGKLRKIDTSGGPAETICDLPGGEIGGSWNSNGTIIFGQAPGGLMRVSANGGIPSPLTLPDPSRAEAAQVFPSFLPDGRHFIYLRISTTPANSGIYLGSLDAKPEEQDSKALLTTQYGPAFAPSSTPGSGYLLFVRDGALLAQQFDTRRMALSGEAVVVAEHVATFRARALFSVSSNGLLSYTSGGTAGYQLRWIDRQGKPLAMVREPSSYLTLAISPDGVRVAVSQFSTQYPVPGLWLLDTSRNTSTRFTFGPPAENAVWSPDGSLIAFNSDRDGQFDLYRKRTDGARDAELLLKSSADKIPTSWSRDGRYLLYVTTDPVTKADLWVLPLGGGRKPAPFLRTEFNEQEGRFSPDGRYVAYTSDESGRNEIYVRAFSSTPSAATPDAGGKWLISNSGGTDPRWPGDGKDLYYVAPAGMLMEVAVATKPDFRAGVPKALFHLPMQSPTPGFSFWDVTPDSKRFLIAAPAAQSASTPFTVVLNWQAGLKAQ
ncbi:MAG: protein kinase domain-containing protein [Candidatus Acidiferrales bacterium]